MDKRVLNKVHPGGSQTNLECEDAFDDSESKEKKLPFYEKDCNKFCPRYWPDSKVCQCGLNFDQHSEDVKNKPSDRKWFSTTSTRKSEWRCFGNIVFENQDTVTNNSPYMRINDDVEVSQLVKYVHEKWQLSKPSLIISVTGGAVDFAMKKKDHDRLRQGLQRVAATKGAWIITGGTNAGVMKICGEAVRDQLLTSKSSSLSNSNNEVVAIGIATWGSIKGKEALIPPADYTPESNSDFEAQYQKPLKGIGLDPNHTHFIFVDDGSNYQFGKEQALRGKFESVLCENGVARKRTKVPIVCVMVEGGPGTIATVINALVNGTPCVVIEGSGRAADVLAYAVNLFEKLNYSDSLSEEDRKEKLGKLIRLKAETILKLQGASLEKSVNWLVQCLDFRNNIRIFKLDEDNSEITGDLDKAILQTLLETENLDIQTQFHLSFLWNRDDMAVQVIAKIKKRDDEDLDETDSSDSDKRNITDEKLDDDDLEKFLTQALMDNKVEFVKLLVEMVPLKMFLTKTKLETLYFDTMQIYKDKFLAEILLTFKRKHYVAEKMMENIHKALLVNSDIQYIPKYIPIEKTRFAKYWNSKDVSDEKEILRCSDPERELFIYSLLFMRHQMSVCFWEDMQCKTSGALFAILLTTAMLESSVVLVDINLQKRVEAMQKDYEQKAIGLLNTCYTFSPETSHFMLQIPHEFWGQKTCLDLAEQADSKTFIAQSGCQTLVREVWLGKISDKNSTWKVVLATIFPIFVYGIWFRSDIHQSLETVKKEPANTSEGRRKLQSTNDQASTTSSGSGSSEHATVSNDTKELVGQHISVLQLDTSWNTMSLVDRYQLFYRAPIVTFILNVSSKVVMLVLFSFVVIAGLKENPSILEIVLMLWMFTLATEEFRQFITILEPTFRKKLKVFFNDRWNFVDIIAIVLFLPGLLIRFQTNTDLLNVAQVFYVLSLITFFIRFTSVFSMHSNLGPKIVMISKMIKDLSFFMYIALVYIIAYGIAVQAVIYPGVSYPLFTVPWGIFFRPFFEMLGEPNFEEVGATKFENCTAGSEALWPYETCPQDNSLTVMFVVFLKALYMLFTNVLLLNLLIAIFNNRYAAVNEQSNLYWAFHRFKFIQEYYNRPWMPPPFTIFYELYLFVMAVKRGKVPRMKRLTETLEPGESSKLEKWEDIRAKEYSRQTIQRLQENIEERVRKIDGKSAKIQSRIEVIDARLEQLDQSISQMDDRCRRTEDMMSMLLHSLANSSSPQGIENLELER